MPVVGIDLGSSCGWAVSSEGRLSSGAWKLIPGKRSLDTTRELTLFRRLEAIRELYGKPELVAYEEVVSHGRSDEKAVKCPRCKAKHRVRIQATNVLAAQVYGGLRGTLMLWCDYHHVRLESVPVGTLKLFATGNGRATKEDMVAWAELRWRDQEITTHDQADALHVLDWAMVEVLRRRGKARIEPSGQLALVDESPEPKLPEVEF